MLRIALRDALGGDGVGRELRLAHRAGLLNAQFEFADRGEILVEFALVARAEADV